VLPILYIDGAFVHVENEKMMRLPPKQQRMVRALLSSVVASLFLLQALAFVFSSNGRIVFSSGETGASIAMAGEICRAKTDDGGKAPAEANSLTV
jgi:hypothetical protein